MASLGADAQPASQTKLLAAAIEIMHFIVLFLSFHFVL